MTRRREEINFGDIFVFRARGGARPTHRYVVALMHSSYPRREIGNIEVTFAIVLV